MKIFNFQLTFNKVIWFIMMIVFLGLFIFLLHTQQPIRMDAQNYTTILQDSHQSISHYLGKRITTSGYIFRGKDFAEEQFVIARDMLISETESNIVGFLCTFPQSLEFENNEWVEASGTIILGDYYGPIPMIKIDTIKRISTPENIFVTMPK